MAIKLQTVLAAWKSFDLNATQRELDETASEITQKQDESDLSRKKLVEQLKEFKKNIPDETQKLAPLIKSFQNEVDSLSKRSKFAETAFLKNYQKFLDIIDPVPALEYSSGLEKKVCLQEELELENKRLKLTLKEYNEELKEVKNQDVTIKNLKEKIKNYEEQMENALNEKTKDLEKNYAAMYTVKENLLAEAHEQSLQKLKDSEEKCQALQLALEQSQTELFEIKTKLDDITEAKSEEIEILMNDLDRANHQTSIAHKKITELEMQYELFANESNDKATPTIDIKAIELSSLEAEIAGKDKEISQLISDIKTLESSLNTLRQNSSVQISHLEDKLHQTESTINTYETKLQEMKDYDELKRELGIIKSIEFEGLENAKKSLESIASKPLELLLLEKNKGLQNENTALKLGREDLMSKYEDLEKEVKNLKSLTSEQQALITQLESDLSSVQSLSHQRDSPSQLNLLSEAVRNVSPVATNQVLNAPESSLNLETAAATESLLSIVSAQRERFKVRNEELEMELATKSSHLMTIQNEMDSLRADNLKLYEKIRFLQSYEGQRKTACDSFPESRYSNQYEKSLDPFLSFSQKEKQKRYHSLSPFEKITLSIGQLILRNKNARIATFVYVSILHCLIFVVLYKFAYTEAWKRDFYSDCARKFAEHMHDVHGET